MLLVFIYIFYPCSFALFFIVIQSGHLAAVRHYKQLFMAD